jgi:hypothetical protein
VTARYDLEPDEVELLIEVCRTLDQCEALQGVLNRDGLEVRVQWVSRGSIRL